MPESAIATGCVDFALPVDAIAAELTRIGAHLPKTEEVGNDSPPEDEAFDRILASMKARTGADFSQYRPTTLRRRMERRAVAQAFGVSAEAFAQIPKAETYIMQGEILPLDGQQARSAVLRKWTPRIHAEHRRLIPRRQAAIE